MSRLALYLLGSPRIECDGTAVQIRRRKAVALLVYLAAAGPKPTGRRPARLSHSREALATLFWPESDQARALAGLRVALAALKAALGDGWLDSDRESVGLNADTAPSTSDPSLRPGRELWLDVAEFQHRLAACRTHGHLPEEVCPACLSALAEAVALYRGDFLAGFTLPDSPAYDEWQFFQAEGLRRELAGALQRLAFGLGAQGAFEQAISYARRWVALDPLHEPAHSHLMRLYAGSGQRAAALRQYAECERVLREELGVPPGEETRQLGRAIRERQEIPPPAISTPIAIRAQPHSRHNLPASPTSFIGRQDQVAEVREMLARPEVRLLTLTGAGGTGKTRLALQVAAGLLDAFPDGVFFVPLAPVRDPALVVPAIAGTLGVREFGEGSLVESLRYVLQDKELLLVVDNLEHVTQAAPALNELLAVAPRLKVLATSRSSLHVYGEHEYRVPPMITPGPDDLPPLEQLAQVEAVQLFVQRAQAARAGFGLDEGNGLAVAEICTRLDGLPLAIELAAARVRLLSPRMMLPHLSSRLHFLTGGPQDLPARQRTLRAAIDWSYDLLNVQAQSLFRRLAVFLGGFTIQAAEAVVLSTCAAEPGSRNLNPETSILDGLESLVDHSLLQASEVDGQARFAMLETIREYALERLEESGEKSATQQRHARFYLALVEEAEPELEGAEQETWLNELEREYDNLRAALAWAAENAADVGLRLAAALGWFWNNRGRFSEGRDWLALALARGAACGPELDRWRAKALAWAGWLATFQEDEAAALSMGRESVALWRTLGEASGLAQALARHAWMVWKRDRAGAQSLLRESIDLYRQVDDKPGLAYALWVDGYRALQVGDHERGRARAAESLDLARECGATAAVARAAGVLSSVAFARGDYPTARSLLEESLALSQEANDRFDMGDVLSRLGNVWYVQGEYGRARVYYQEALQICRAAGARYATAGVLAKLAYAASRQGLEAEARACLAETWALCRGTAFERGGIAACLLGGAGLAEAQGQPERAARLLGTAEAVLEDVYWHLTAMFPLESDRVVSAVRGQLDEATFATAWAEGRAAAAAAADEGWERECFEPSL